MKNGFGRVTRTTVFMAVFVVVLMLGLPSFGTGHDVAKGAVDQASAAAGARTLYIGWVGMRDSVATLNPLLYTMAGEMSVIWPCYSYLTQYDVDGVTKIGDLAKSWSVSTDGRTWHFSLYSTATFYNKSAPSQVHPVTAADVIFTYYLIQNQTGNYLQSYLPHINKTSSSDHGIAIIEDMWKVGDYELYIRTVVPYAPFLSATSSMPILPKYIWGDRVERPSKYGPAGGWNWPNMDSKLGVPPIVGSGSVYFMENGLTTTGDYRLGKNPKWIGTIEYGWTLRTDVIYYKSETSETSNYNDYKAGAVDVMIGVTPAQYLSTTDRLTDYGNKFAKDTGFVYELNINQINKSIRDEYNIAPQLGGKDNPILNDPVFRLAVQMSVNKQGFVADALGGLGTVADSLIPSASPWHYWYGLQPGEDPLRAGRAPVGEEPVAYDPVAARYMLMANGWKYRLDGTQIVAGDSDFFTYKPLCKAGPTQPLQFRFWTLNTLAQWDAGAQYIINTTAIAGIDLRTLYDLKSIGQMNSAWAQANYDMWLWDWMFSPTSEPSTDVMQVLASEAIGSWSDVYVSDPAYDKLYYDTLTAVDPGARIVLLDQLQRIAYDRHDCQLVAYRSELYAAGPATKSPDSDHWTNYGNWEQDWLLMPDQLAPYLYMRIQPRDQPAPQIISVPDSVTIEKGQTLSLTATATDANGLAFKWFWGDGAKWATWGNVTSETSGSSTGTHPYANDGYYTAYLAVKENGGDQFVNSTKIRVKVTDNSNHAPTFSVAADYWPQVPAPDEGTTVYLDATATDTNPGDTLTYWWVTSDGHTLMGKNVTHQFRDRTLTNAICYVDDGHVSSEDRPVPSAVLVPVAKNYPPSITVPPAINVPPNTLQQFNVTADDQNSLDKTRWQFWWDWGDGSPWTNTSEPTAWHTFAFKKVYNYKVYVNDMTGIDGHNVSGTNVIQVRSPGNSPPEIQAGSFVVTPLSVVQGQTITLSGAVRDPDKDYQTVSFEIYDSLAEIYEYCNTTSTTKYPSYTTVTTTYTFAIDAPVDTYTIWMTTWDNQDPAVYALESYDVAVAYGNQTPIVPLLPAKLNLTVGMPHTFSIAATDPENDHLTYFWDFANGVISTLDTPSYAFNAANISASHLYLVSVDDGTGLFGHNITRYGYAEVNDVPSIKTGLSERTVNAQVLTTFDVVAWDDDDNMSVNYIFDWGDGTPWSTVLGIGNTTHTYANPTAEIQDYTVTVYVNDMYVDVDGYSHNVSSTAVVHVQKSFTLNLIKGWNFVTVPRIGGGYKASTLGLAKYDTVVQYNATSKLYDKTYLVGISPSSQDFVIAQSTAYWVNVNQNETLILVGTIPTGPQIKTFTLMTSGWVNLAFNTINPTWKASKVLTMVSGGNVTTVAWLNPATKIYKTYIANVTPSDYTLTPGQGLWVNVIIPGPGPVTVTFTYTP